MLIVKFHGGLGNQMYQYAFYKNIQKKFPELTIKADLDRYIYKKQLEHNGFELDTVFKNISMDVASTEEILESGGLYERHKAGLVDIVKKAYWKRSFDVKQAKGYSTAVFEDQWILYNNMPIEELKNQELWICGYWVAPELVDPSLFVFRNELDEKNKRIYEKMEKSNSVSIHVRRGDYVGTEFDVVTLDYYKKAINYLEERVENIQYFVFSDDKIYVEKIFSSIPNFTIVDNNVGISSYKDMQLMSCCKHNVICNSTFSAWGAFLNKNSNKIAIYPKGYLKADSLTCGEWIGV